MGPPWQAVVDPWSTTLEALNPCPALCLGPLLPSATHEQVAARGVHGVAHGQDLGAALRAGVLPLPVQVGAHGVGAQVPPHRAVGVHLQGTGPQATWAAGSWGDYQTRRSAPGSWGSRAPPGAARWHWSPAGRGLAGGCRFPSSGPWSLSHTTKLKIRRGNPPARTHIRHDVHYRLLEQGSRRCVVRVGEPLEEACKGGHGRGFSGWSSRGCAGWHAPELGRAGHPPFLPNSTRRAFGSPLSHRLPRMLPGDDPDGLLPLPGRACTRIFPAACACLSARTFVRAIDRSIE